MPNGRMIAFGLVVKEFENTSAMRIVIADGYEVSRSPILDCENQASCSGGHNWSATGHRFDCDQSKGLVSRRNGHNIRR